MGIPFWVNNPGAWDRPVFDFGEGDQVLTLRMPGISKVKGKGIAKLDKKSAPGSSGATVTYLGAEPIEVEITTTIWDQTQLQELDRIIRMLAPRPTKGLPKPVRVSHPKLAMFGVSKLFVSEIGMLEESGSARGAMDITIHFVQYLPPIGGQTLTNGKVPPLESLNTPEPANFSSASTFSDAGANYSSAGGNLVAKPAPNFSTSDGRGVRTPPPSETNSGPFTKG